MKKYLDLIKFTLTFLVIFSYVVCYILAAPRGQVDVLRLIVLVICGFFVAGAGNAANQLIEQDTDKLMLRTSKRPIVTGKISPLHAKIFIVLLLALGLVGMYIFFNPLSSLLAAFSFFSYVYIYTPLKKKSSIAVFVGALPGALPCLIGWVAYTGEIDVYGLSLFLIQFFWQFPHFWSLAWLVDEDYKRAGYHLLPFGLKPSREVAVQTFAFSLLLFMVSLLPPLLGMVEKTALYVIVAVNLLVLWKSFQLIINVSTPKARQVMFSCYIFLPVVFLTLLLFKI